MMIEVNKNDEIFNLIMQSLKNKDIKINNLKSIEADFDAITKIIKYRIVNEGKAISGEIQV